MQKTVIAFIVTACLEVLDVAGAAYVIRLKNGNEYVTTRYWQEGSQVLFDAEGGVFGVEKTFISKIEKTDKIVRSVTTADRDPREKPEATLKEIGNDVAKEALVPEAKAPATKNENDSVHKEFNGLKSQSDDLRTMLASELDEYLKRIIALIAKIQNERKTNQYLREYSELNAMANGAEAELNSRR